MDHQMRTGEEEKMQTCVITKMYTTARGTRGVCYTLGGTRGATFIPAHLEGMDEVRAWLADSLGVPVKPAHLLFARLTPGWLARLAGATHPSSQARMLALGREHVGGLTLTNGSLVANVTSQSGGGHYEVTFDLARETARCSCPHATHNPEAVCKHVGALARLLLAHPDVVGGTYEGLSHVPTAPTLTRGLSVGWAYVTDVRDGALRLEGTSGSRWVGISELVLCDVAEHDGRPGAWVGVLPGHPLEQVGLGSTAPSSTAAPDHARRAA